jgi:hypothetical protein
MTLFDEEIARLDVERADLAARAARETDDGRRAYVDAIVARVERARATLAAAAAADSGVEKPTTTGRDVAGGGPPAHPPPPDATSRACTRAISRRDVFDSNTSPRIPRS